MDVTLRKSPFATRSTDVLAVAVAEGAKLSGPALALDRATRGAVAAVLASGDFKGRLAETAVLYPKGVKAKRVLLVGLGRAAGAAAWAKAAAQAARRARDAGARTLALAFTDGALDAADFFYYLDRFVEGC